MNDVDPSYFDIYDDIAYAVCDSDHPLESFGLGISNQEVCGEICDAWDVEYFDMFEDINPEDAEVSTDSEIVKAAAFLYLLRFQVFSIAKREEIGDPTFNEMVMAHSELWYMRLCDRYGELTSGRRPDRTWMN